MAITESIERELKDVNRELLEENRRLKAELAALRAGSQTDQTARAEKLNLIIESTQVGTWDWDPHTDFVAWNRNAFAMFGLEPGDAPTSFAKTAERIHPADAPHVRLALLKHLERGDRFGTDLRARQSDGSYKWVHCCGRAIRDRSGRATRVIGLLFDVDERKRSEICTLGINEKLNLQVTQREQELRLARQELEEFCYALSHDLRTPLRSINGFSYALEHDYADKLDALGKDYLQRVQRASMNLADLLDSLLGMVRISRVEMHPEAVNLTELAFYVANDLQELHPGREVNLLVHGGLVTFGDPRLLRLMLTNLLSNAWKFTSGRKTARIEIGVEGDVFFVRDNGAGFEMQYSQKLYKPFQKLHSSARFPGSGIGLTIAQRIAARHGGTLWGESKGEDAGATFYFRLPCDDSSVSALDAMLRSQPSLPMA